MLRSSHSYKNDVSSESPVDWFEAFGRSPVTRSCPIKPLVISVAGAAGDPVDSSRFNSALISRLALLLRPFEELLARPVLLERRREPLMDRLGFVLEGVPVGASGPGAMVRGELVVSVVLVAADCLATRSSMGNREIFGFEDLGSSTLSVDDIAFTKAEGSRQSKGVTSPINAFSDTAELLAPFDPCSFFVSLAMIPRISVSIALNRVDSSSRSRLKIIVINPLFPVKRLFAGRVKIASTTP
mmetsp:Transcript_6199/g.17472  ORF Transcript_6199/g.17472 Transcript_6199/m.17472 type:complete len:242 (-) Transcript_6199:3879-4604(-)